MKYLITFLLLTISIYAQDRLALFTGTENTFSKRTEINLYEDIILDYEHFYSKKTFDNSLFWLTAGVLLSSIDIDYTLSHWYQDNVRSEKSDRWSGEFKHYGNGEKTLPILAGSALLGYGLQRWGVDGEGYIYDWSSKSLRSIFVGTPVLLLSQKTSNVSGHAFMGAIPFITAAQMTDDIIFKTSFYLGSTLCAWSRVNDDEHYLSQSLLGWSLAYVSTLAVFDRESAITLSPFIDNGRWGINFSIKF